MRAFVRNPNKLPAHLRNKVEVVKGDVLVYNDVLNAIKNVSGVVVALGPTDHLRPTTVMSDGMKNIVKAMKESNVEVVSVCISEFLFHDIAEIPAIYHPITNDHQRMYDVIRSSGLKYIACFPPYFVGM